MSKKKEKKVSFNENENQKFDSRIKLEKDDLKNWYTKKDFKEMARDYKMKINSIPEVREEYEKRHTKRDRKEILRKANEELNENKRLKRASEQNAGSRKKRKTKKKYNRKKCNPKSTRKRMKRY